MLANKTILITGSARGIGAAAARLAKGYGAQVILHGKTESEELKNLAKELSASYIVCDVGNEREVMQTFSNITNVDILVNNAGISISKPFLELTAKDWHDTYHTNVFGVVNVSKAVIPHMLKRNYGRIINVSSIKGHPYTAGRAAFAASKAALHTLTASMAKEFAPHILVNCIAPGFTDTETTKEAWSQRIYTQISKTPLSRAATPEEVAETILFLASNQSRFITGQTITVDGGYSISN